MDPELRYIQSVRAAFNPAYTQLATDGLYLAIPHTRCSVGVWSLQHLSFKPLELEGHRKILTSISLGSRSSPKLLCSAAEDYVIVWNLLKARQMVDKGMQIRGQIIGTALGHIHYCSFSPDDKLVAACCGADVIILDASTEHHVATVEGHTSKLTSAQFCPHYSATLVTISEDRTFKVWNIEDFSLIYQSPILTASPFISMAMNLTQPQVAIGTADGQVRVFDLTDGKGFRQLHQIGVDKIVRKQKTAQQYSSTSSPTGPVTISSKPTWKRVDQNEMEPVGDQSLEDEAEAGCSVLGLYFTFLPQGGVEVDNSSKPVFLQHKSTVVQDLLSSSPMLVVGTTGAMIQINAKTLDVCKFWDLQDPVQIDNGLVTENVSINAAGAVYISQGANVQKLWCIVCGHFQNTVHILEWCHGSAVDEVTSDLDNLEVSEQGSNLPSWAVNSLDTNDLLTMAQKADELTVLSNVALAENSPLRSELVFKQKEDTRTKKQKGYLTPNKKPGQRIEDQPLTFKTNVKSSGYTASPRNTMFKPRTDFSSSASAASRGLPKSASSGSVVGKMNQKQYPTDCSAPSVLQTKINVAERPTPIHCVRFSDDGQSLACGLANKSAQMFSMPLTGKGSSYVGHDHTVSCVNWSHDSNWLISSSDDRTACVWGKGRAEPLMTFTTTANNLSVDKEGAQPQKPSKDNPPFPREVKFGRFYYMDKFILLTSGSTLFMYKYHLDLTKQDIKRYLSKSRYKLVTSFSLETQQITALSAVNGFYSYLVLCAGTNKCIEIQDMNVGQTVRTMTDVHTKPAHVICQNEGSTFTSHPPDAYNLFVTAAAGDCIKLWDIRTNRCVRRYEGHLNRVYPCGVDLSPCGRYLATGSEDRSTYIYDIRTGTYCHKLTDHTDVVSDVAFHPKYPQLLSCSLAGKLVLYADKLSS
ncbi:WD repeat-containing protein 27 [Mizuhopecten yessoensis]|uniref:WD repeat-containing protein 27 n=1 Tax=Mizuhopecten yessoensis TaxID=6573 RepID=A0A210PP53_MIZYE|nr:WD repeat-containing protein 27 [Mizuhopecten yessoensis]